MAGKSFRKGLGIIELMEMFPDEDAARTWFEETRWPDGRTCAHCGSERTSEASHAKMPYWCADCRSYFSVKTGTVMEASKIKLQWTFRMGMAVARRSWRRRTRRTRTSNCFQAKSAVGGQHVHDAMTVVGVVILIMWAVLLLGFLRG